MTLSEFKAWFESFSEGIESAPTAEQFAKIKAKVAKIDGQTTTYPVFIDRYWPTVYPRYGQYWGWAHQTGDEMPRPLKVWCASGNATSSANASSEAQWDGGTFSGGFAGNATGRGYGYIPPDAKGDNQTVVFDVHAAMRDLGRAESAA